MVPAALATLVQLEHPNHFNGTAAPSEKPCLLLFHLGFCSFGSEWRQQLLCGSLVCIVMM
jgi:hypothetical protein